MFGWKALVVVGVFGLLAGFCVRVNEKTFNVLRFGGHVVSNHTAQVSNHTSQVSNQTSQAEILLKRETL